MKYTGTKLCEISFPLGGIGTGSIGLAGNGSLRDWEIFNRPNKGSVNGYTFIAIKAQWPDGRHVVKILQGDQQKDLIGQYGKRCFSGYGFGPASTTMAGFPHFLHLEFDGEFPIATLKFEDPNFPGTVTLTAFNPFIPLDSENSSIPAAFFDIALENGNEDVRYSVMFSLTNPFAGSVNCRRNDFPGTAITLACSEKEPDDTTYGDLTLACDRPGFCQEYWYRGGWQDGIAAFWHDVNAGELQPRRYDTPGKNDVCTIGFHTELAPGQKDHARFVLAWNVPNNYNYWDPLKDENGRDITWKNYYATRYEDSAASCRYAMEHFDALYAETDAFRKALHGSTLPPAVIDAAASTLSVLKSPTVLRLTDGTFYGWEGVHELEGSCEGTCTHVWSYAYALCFLFPDLERSLRNTEFRYNTDETGAMFFRTTLPLGRGFSTQYVDGHPLPCVDGQMATVIKIYRDWKITGNSEWLRDNWENIKKVLEFAWNEHNHFEWDKNKDGVLEGRQHHTLDMELFGPSSWLESMYLAALKAAAEMAAFLGEKDKCDEYTALFNNGYQWMKENLFNGSYFCQKVDLNDAAATTEHFDFPNYWNSEAKELKYQIADGCAIDQMLGQWHANLCGLGDVFDPEQRRTALRSMMKNNFKTSMREFANPWRIFSLNDEQGTIICDYPEGSYKPMIPITYCEETMHGFEYAFAGLLVTEGMTEEGTMVAKAVRDRYDGEKRNPWNEIECGNNYARSMASFALLPAFSGFSYDLPHDHIGFAPKHAGDYRCLWSLGTGWGVFERNDGISAVRLEKGNLTLSSLGLDNAEKIRSLTIDGKEIPFTAADGKLCFEKTIICSELIAAE